MYRLAQNDARCAQSAQFQKMKLKMSGRWAVVDVEARFGQVVDNSVAGGDGGDGGSEVLRSAKVRVITFTIWHKRTLNYLKMRQTRNEGHDILDVKLTIFTILVARRPKS
jgi:hypothetical protein